MKKLLRSALQSLLAAVIFFLILESGCWILGFPPGGSSFAEGVVLRHHLSPHKPKDELRIFAFGESTMHGAHYWPVSSPARWLEVYLHDFLPGKNIRIVNFGRMGQGAYKCLNVFKYSLHYHPDLVIFYLGHNSFLPRNGYREVMAKERKWSKRLREWSHQSRLLSAVYRSLLKWKIKHKDGMSEDRMGYDQIETQPPVLTLDSPSSYRRISPSYWENVLFFRDTVGEILRLTEEKNIPALFLKPAGNLKDFSPGLSDHMRLLSPSELAAWEEAFQKGKALEEKGDEAGALASYHEAYVIDPTYAELAYRMGTIYLHQTQYDKARRLFKAARDHDLHIVRATSDIIRVLQDYQKKRELVMIDTEKILAPETEGGILGEPVIEDNVHFSIQGHALVGRAMAEEIAKRGWIAPRLEWRFERERGFEEMEKEIGVNPDLLFTADLRMAAYFSGRNPNRIRFARKALAIRPEDPSALRHLAWAYWEMNDKDEAMKIYETLDKNHPGVLQSVLDAHPGLRQFWSSRGEK